MVEYIVRLSIPNQTSSTQHNAVLTTYRSLQYIYVCTRHNKTRVLNKSRNDGNHGATGNTLLIRVLWFVKPVPLVDRLQYERVRYSSPLDFGWNSVESAKLDFGKKKQQQGKGDVQGGPSVIARLPPSLPSANPRWHASLFKTSINDHPHHARRQPPTQ